DVGGGEACAVVGLVGVAGPGADDLLTGGGDGDRRDGVGETGQVALLADRADGDHTGVAGGVGLLRGLLRLVGTVARHRDDHHALRLPVPDGLPHVGQVLGLVRAVEHFPAQVGGLPDAARRPAGVVALGLDRQLDRDDLGLRGDAHERDALAAHVAGADDPGHLGSVADAVLQVALRHVVGLDAPPQLDVVRVHAAVDDRDLHAPAASVLPDVGEVQPFLRPEPI